MMRIGRKRTRFEPQRARRNGRIYSYLPPPSGFIAKAMHLAMMSSTQRDSEFIADLAAESPGLRKAQMMRVTGLATANQARLLGHMADMIAVADPARLGKEQRALIDAFGRDPVLRIELVWAYAFRRLLGLS